MKLLVVEDEQKIAAALKKGLEFEGYVVDVAHDSDQAAMLLNVSDYDLFILDWMIPGQYDGQGLCRYIRESGLQSAILMLTAKSAIGDKVSGLDAGADDYLTKPFSFDELLARIRSLLRRPSKFSGSNLELDSLTVDTIQKTAQRNSQPIELTAKEFAILMYLLKSKGRVVGKDELIEHIWPDEDRPLPNTVEAFIKRLREKIDRPFPHETQLIHTKRGFGYRLGVES